MNYEELITTISLLVENEKIYKTGLTLVYELDDKNHKQMNQHLYYKANQSMSGFVANDEFEILLGGILVKFVKIPVLQADPQE